MSTLNTPDAPVFRRLLGRMMPLAMDNVDTDQVIPAAYLKTTTRQGLGQGLFAGWRRLADHSPNPDFVLNDPRYNDATVLVAGNNFGCGSSREHAPWALLDYGFRMVISASFADIFRSNAVKNGLLPVEVPTEVRDRLMAQAEKDPSAQVQVDLERCVLTEADGVETGFVVDAFSRRCLLDGVDAMGYLLGRLPEIESWEQANGRAAGQGLDTRVGSEASA